MANLRTIELVPSAARTTTGNGSDSDIVHSGGSGAAYLDVTAASGTTPSMTVLIEEYDPISNKYYTAGTFAAKTAVSRERIAITFIPGAKYRASWTITGTTPSFTFTVSAGLKG